LEGGSVGEQDNLQAFEGYEDSAAVVAAFTAGSN
jgi:hypothetical protein